MGKLHIQLNQKYRSFNSGFEATINGDLVIISGVNGSGKSQLLEIIKRINIYGPQPHIDANVTLDNEVIQSKEVLLKSFRDNVNISELTQATAQNITNARSQIVSAYTSNRLNPDDPANLQYSFTIRKAREILISLYGEADFYGGLDNRQVEAAIQSDFIYRQDDVFTNAIGEIFYNYCLKRQSLEADAGRTALPVDLSSLGEKPWIELNSLFAKLHLDYRFKDEYSVNGIDMDEQPVLYAIKRNGEIDLDDTRQLNSFSDGEKAIISLCFASLSGIDIQEKKVVLLDEYDATLNPSLIKNFYTVLDEFFVSRGIMVIIVTHSAATIALAPENTIFYEVYKANVTQTRILEVARDNYEELQEVNRRFYETISQQQTRLNDILEQNTQLAALNERLSTSIASSSEKPLIITEGYTDSQHIKKAFEILGLDDIDVEYWALENAGNSLGAPSLDRKLKELATVHQSRKIIGIFDRDIPEYLEAYPDVTDLGNNVFAFCIPEPEFRQGYTNISIEFYYPDVNIKKEKDGKRLYFTNELDTYRPNRHGQDPIIKLLLAPIESEELSKKIASEQFMGRSEDWIFSKSAFARLVAEDEDFISDFDFSNFILIYEKIKAITE